MFPHDEKLENLEDWDLWSNEGPSILSRIEQHRALSATSNLRQAEVEWSRRNFKKAANFYRLYRKHKRLLLGALRKRGETLDTLLASNGIIPCDPDERAKAA